MPGSLVSHPIVKAPLNRRRGFTLVELLVVIGIIALLISILLPALSKARAAANTTACAANLHSMGQALVMYVNQYKHFPGAQSALGTGISGPASAFGIWPVRLRNMMNGNQKAFWCPATDISLQWNANRPGVPKATLAHETWGYNVGETLLQVDLVQFSYGYNDWGTVNPYVSRGGRPFYVGLGGDCWMQSEPTHAAVAEANASDVVRSAECIIISDVVERFPIPNGIWLMNVDPVYASEGPSAIHAGGSNVLFCDGHVTRMALADIACYDVKNSSHPILPPGDQYDQRSRLWNRDNQPHRPDLNPY